MGLGRGLGRRFDSAVPLRERQGTKRRGVRRVKVAVSLWRSQV